MPILLSFGKPHAPGDDQVSLPLHGAGLQRVQINDYRFPTLQLQQPRTMRKHPVKATALTARASRAFGAHVFLSNRRHIGNRCFAHVVLFAITAMGFPRMSEFLQESRSQITPDRATWGLNTGYSYWLFDVRIIGVGGVPLFAIVGL